jgi:hypothetical protein
LAERGARFSAHHGCGFSGAGGGFMLVVAAEGAVVPDGFQVELTRRAPPQERAAGGVVGT